MSTYGVKLVGQIRDNEVAFEEGAYEGGGIYEFEQALSYFIGPDWSDFLSHPFLNALDPGTNEHSIMLPFLQGGATVSEIFEDSQYGFWVNLEPYIKDVARGDGYTRDIKGLLRYMGAPSIGPDHTDEW